jgi:hypothetical protein
VLQELVRVHDVERCVCKRQLVHVGRLQVDRHTLIFRVRRRLSDHLGRAVDAGHATRRHTAHKIDGDRARAASDVEQGKPRPQRGQKVAGRVLGRTPRVAAQHRLVMSVRVDMVCHDRTRVNEGQRAFLDTFNATAARTRAFNAFSLIFSPS